MRERMPLNSFDVIIVLSRLADRRMFHIVPRPYRSSTLPYRFLAISFRLLKMYNKQTALIRFRDFG